MRYKEGRERVAIRAIPERVSDDIRRGLCISEYGAVRRGFGTALYSGASASIWGDSLLRSLIGNSSMPDWMDRHQASIVETVAFAIDEMVGKI